MPVCDVLIPAVEGAGFRFTRRNAMVPNELNRILMSMARSLADREPNPGGFDRENILIRMNPKTAVSVSNSPWCMDHIRDMPEYLEILRGDRKTDDSRAASNAMFGMPPALFSFPVSVCDEICHGGISGQVPQYLFPDHLIKMNWSDRLDSPGESCWWVAGPPESKQSIVRPQSFGDDFPLPIKRAFQRMFRGIHRASGGALEVRDLTVKIGPDTALKMAFTQEFTEYVKQSPYALAQFHGDVPVENDASGKIKESRLVNPLYGFHINIQDNITDDTIYMTVNTESLSWRQDQYAAISERMTWAEAVREAEEAWDDDTDTAK